MRCCGTQAMDTQDAGIRRLINPEASAYSTPYHRRLVLACLTPTHNNKAPSPRFPTPNPAPHKIIPQPTSSKRPRWRKAEMYMPRGSRKRVLHRWQASPMVGVYTMGASSSMFSIRAL